MEVLKAIYKINGWREKTVYIFFHIAPVHFYRQSPLSYSILTYFS